MYVGRTMPNKCEDCGYRFTCFTLGKDEQPVKVRVNWKVAGLCYTCVHSQFSKDNYSGRGFKDVGLCKKHTLLIHKKSTCPEHQNKTTRTADGVYTALRKELSRMHRKNKVPVYCVIEE